MISIKDNKYVLYLYYVASKGIRRHGFGHYNVATPIDLIDLFEKNNNIKTLL